MSTDDAVTIRPRKVRRVAFVLAPIVVVFFVILGALLSGPTGQDNDAVFTPADQGAMMILGLFVAAAVLLIARPRVVADRRRIKIQNIIGGYDLPWGVVRAVRFDRSSPWLTLELDNDDVVAVMAIQATDKDHAVAAARTLRALFATTHPPTPTPTPTPPRS